MNWNDLGSTWRQQTPSTTKDLDPAVLRQTFETKSRKQTRHLFWRDFRSSAVGLLEAGYLIYLGCQPRMSAYRWPFGIAVVMILAVTAYCILQLVRMRRSRPQPAAPLLAKLDADLAELNHQRHLLLVVSPRLLAVLMVGVAVLIAAPFLVNGTMTAKQVRVTVIMIAAFAVVLKLSLVRNRWDVSKRVEPRILELERLRHALLALQ